MFSLLWSEHCAYKHSRKLLRRLPTEGARVLMGPGRERRRRRRRGGPRDRLQGRVAQPPERRGAVPGGGDRSRRHPARRLRPGSRPIAVLDSLRFGELSTRSAPATCSTGWSPGSATTATRSGCPRWAARSTSRRRTSSNCLVNAMCVGLAPTDRMVRSAAAGPGNLVVLLGASTGRDGIGGASVLASAELAEGEEKRPTRSDRRPVRGEEADGVLPRAARSRACWWRSRTSAPRASPPPPPRWPPRAGWGSTSPSTACPCARPTWSRSRS